jgi:hypothetical protein
MSYDNFLSNEQIQLINMYNTQYNRTLTQVDRLLDTLDNIRDNINQLIEQGNSRSNFVRRQRRSNNRNRNMFFSNNLNSNVNDNINDNANLFSILRTRRFEPTFIDYLNTVVPVRPTNENIQHATRSLRYRDIPNPQNDSCPISLDRFEQDDLVTQIIHCGHIFCQTELQEWFQDHVRCPVCRYDIRDYTATSLEASSSTPTSLEASSSTPTSSNISNLTVVRNPTTNQAEQIMFDLEVDNQLNNITSQILQSLFSQNRNNTRQN